MDKINDSKDAREDDSLVRYDTESKVVPWRSYFSQRQNSSAIVVGGISRSVHGQVPSRNALGVFSRKGLDLKNSRGQGARSWRSLFCLFHPVPLSVIGILLPLAAVFTVAWFSGFTPHRATSAGVSSQAKTIGEYSVPANPGSLEDTWQNWKDGLRAKTGYLERNEALVFLLKRYGLSQKQSSDLVLGVQEEVDLTKLRAEDPIQLFFTNDKSNQLVGFQIGSKEKTVSAYLYRGESKSEVQYHELSAKTFQAVVQVERSLYQDGIDQGIPGSILLDMFNRYSFDINFQSDIQRGTHYEIVYTMIYNEKDERVGSGEILYANIVLADDRSFPIFEYTDMSGKSEFFNSEGRSINKALLLMPVNGAYVSSNFGYRRDPILGTWRLHRGTDYAAPRGTPIKAGGTGRIITRGWSRIGYGYYIIIRHKNSYDTLYGHMSRFRFGYKVGSRVRQGDIIGYVGSTGKSTGPHVHYEVRRYGKPVGLRSLRLQSSRDLAGIDKNLFDNSIRALQARFRELLPNLQNIHRSVNLVQNKEPSQDPGIGGAISVRP